MPDGARPTLTSDQRARLLAELARCRPWIEAALLYCDGKYAWEDVAAACLSADMQLWPGSVSAAVTTISRYPRRTGCTVIFAGGDIEELRAALAPRIEAWAASVGCDHLTVIGRAGWCRALGMGHIVATHAAKDI